MAQADPSLCSCLQLMGTGMEDLFSCGHSCHVCEKSCTASWHGMAYKHRGQKLRRSWVWYRHLLPDFVPFHDGFRMQLEVWCPDSHRGRNGTLGFAHAHGHGLGWG